MKEYISTIIYISIFSVILELILPNNKLKKYIASLVGILVILIIASPLIDILKNDNVVLAISTAIEEISMSSGDMTHYDFTKEKNRIINNSVRNRLEQEIMSNLTNNFSEFVIKRVDILLNSDYVVEGISVTAKNITDVKDASKIINYLTEEYNVKEQVINIIRGE